MNQSSPRFTVDIGAVSANYRILRAAAPGAAVAGVVKSDAYGLGAERVAPALAQEGCRHFFVSTPEEAATLRAFVPEGEIYVLHGPRGLDAASARTRGIIPVLNSFDDIALWRAAGEGAPCALHFDTGMNRLGFDPDETRHVTDTPDSTGGLSIRGVLSHFACSDDAGHPLNGLQCDRFSALHAALAPRWPEALWSLCNSSGVFHAKGAHYDLVRPGYALYGGNPTPGKPSPMHPAVRVDAPVLQVRTAPRGGTSGYGATHLFEEDTKTATVAIGYAEGLHRALSNRGQVFWRGVPCPVLGRVSMNLVIVGIGHLGRHVDEDAPQPGDAMEVVGPHQSLEALAAQAGTIGYEIMTSLGAQASRHYK